MKILIVGVSGFIGQHIYFSLCQRGHHVTGCSRQKVSHINWQACDIMQSSEQWALQLQGIDVVINAVGIYKQNSLQRFSQVHNAGAKKLFDACAKNNIRVIQISAIGAELKNPVTDFLKSKRAADQYLLKQEQPHVILYPGIVLGERGRSTRQFSLLAHLFCIPVIFGKHKKLPLISIQQLSRHIVDIINDWPATKQSYVLIAEPETMEHFLTNLRLWMRMSKGCFLYIPEKFINKIFSLFPELSMGLLNKQSVDMLTAYSPETYKPATNETASDSLLKNQASENFIKNIRLSMLFYINLLTLSIIWIISGISSIVNFEQSRELITLVGVYGNLADSIIYIAAVGDILLGLFLWLPGLQRYVIYAQIAVMIVYSIIISIFIPIYWLHPFAPVIKNLAMFVLALYLLLEDKE